MKLKPLKKAGIPPLLQEIRGQTLTKIADEVLINNANIISEGEIKDNGNGSLMFYGSTMVTIDLSSFISNNVTNSKWKQALLNGVSRSISFRIRLMRIARAQSEQRTSPYLLRQMTTELEFKIEKSKLLVDIDIECPLAQPVLSVEETIEETN